MKDRLEHWELQQLTLMLGSAKALQTYLRIPDKQFRDFWKEKGLLTPVQYVRARPLGELVRKLQITGSTAKVAEYYGVSEAFIKGVLREEFSKELEGTRLTPEIVERYASVRFVARMTGQPESAVRKYVKDHKLEHKLAYDFSDHNNAKGRRAELFWAGTRGGPLIDMNVMMGSQATYDFMDPEYNRVNVKSSKAHRFKAYSRKDNRLFWKLSTAGLENADCMAAVLYDMRGQEVVDHFTMMVEDMRKKGLLQKNSLVVQLDKTGRVIFL